MANKAVFGIYAMRRQVENAVAELKAQGFRNTDIISVLFAHEKTTKAPERVAAGATSGAVIVAIRSSPVTAPLELFPPVPPRVISGAAVPAVS